MEFDRPPSEQLVDLHVFVVPPELWLENLHSAFNKIVSDVVSAGFIRVHPEMPLPYIRQEIEKQLGTEFLPREYIFCRSVGRRFAQVKPRQEKGLKVKYFLPPHAYCPELFVLDSNAALRSQATSDGSLSQISLGSQGPAARPDRRGKSPAQFEIGNDSGYLEDDDLDRIKKDLDVSDDEEKRRREEECEKNHRWATPPRRRSPKPKDDDHAKEAARAASAARKAATRLQEVESLNRDDAMRRKKEMQEEEEEQRQEIRALQNRIEASSARLRDGEWNPQDFRSRKEEIEALTIEIERRREKLASMEGEHAERIRLWEKEEQERRELESHRQMEFEQLEQQRRDMEEELASKQREELRKLEERLQQLRRHWEEEEKRMALEEKERKEQEEKRKKELEEKYAEMEREKEKFAYDPDFEQRVDNLKDEIASEEEKRKKAEEEMRKRREEASKEYEDAKRKYSEDKENWEVERKEREAQRELRYSMEMQLREDADRRRKEHEERMKQELERMEEERRRFVEDQQKWQEEQEKYSEEENKRAQETEDKIRQLQADKPLVPILELGDVPEGVERNYKAEKKALQQNLEEMRRKRMDVERRREEMIKKARQLQAKTQNRRNQARDWWKKKYFEEKKKTPPLEDQVNRHRSELESIHRRMMGTMETTLKEKRSSQRNPHSSMPSDQASKRIQAARIQHEIEEMQRRVDEAKMRLTSEIKLRTQAEAELRALRTDLTQKKINLTLTRSQQMAAIAGGDSFTPRSPMITNRA